MELNDLHPQSSPSYSSRTGLAGVVTDSACSTQLNLKGFEHAESEEISYCGVE